MGPQSRPLPPLILHPHPSPQPTQIPTTLNPHIPSKQVAGWIGSVHGPTQMVVSDFRPVPLKYHFIDNEGMCVRRNDSCIYMYIYVCVCIASSDDEGMCVRT